MVPLGPPRFFSSNQRGPDTPPALTEAVEPGSRARLRNTGARGGAEEREGRCRWTRKLSKGRARAERHSDTVLPVSVVATIVACGVWELHEHIRSAGRRHYLTVEVRGHYRVLQICWRADEARTDNGSRQVV